MSQTPDTPEANGAATLPFQAEVQQVLSLVINSLYANQEVFLRELISNASDALDKAKYLSLTRKDVSEQVGEAKIDIRLDDDARTLTIEDNGIGMTRDEVISNLGTIAKSGTIEFLRSHAEQMRQDPANNAKLIGQFGVGFYAAFMVASRVDVNTKSMLPGAEPVLWRSSGEGTFTIAAGERQNPGTEIVLHLKDDCKEYLKAYRAKDIVRKYSDFVHFPIFVNAEQANKSKALWALPKGQVTDEEHAEFFHHVTEGMDGEKPLLTIHTSVDAPVQYHALLYVPEKAPFDLFQKERRGLRLYAKRVLIIEDTDKLTPAWLRFLRGVVDSEDLSLNVSREMLQENRTLMAIQQQIIKQSLKVLKDTAESEPEKYEAFWREFGRVLKEGTTLEFRHKDAIAELCRFESMKTDATKLISLKQYIEAMPEEQKAIYYVTGVHRKAVEHSPHLEAFKKRGYDVLFLVDPIDEWFVKAVLEFEKKPLRSIAHGDVDLPAEDTPKGDEVEPAVKAVKEALGDRVKDVRLSKRLTDSASCLVAAEGDPGANMERILRMVDQAAPERKRILELNPSSPIVKNIASLATKEWGSDRIKAWSEMLYDQALLSEGVVEDPASLVKRIQDLLTQVSGAAVS